MTGSSPGLSDGLAPGPGGALVGLLTKEDLFSPFPRHWRPLGAELQRAPDLGTLQALAPEIPGLARQLLSQGVAARTITELISPLNDAVVHQVVALWAAHHGLDLARACWVAFGSEGRAEQTIATDQDNGLVLDDAVDEQERQRWQAMAHDANQTLAACGFPLCKGGVMAGEPACTQTQAAWQAAFRHWMGQCEPEDLLRAGIFFDLRPIAGRAELALPLRTLIRQHAPQRPRFLRLMAEHSLDVSPALDWHGGLDAESLEGGRLVDLKLHGSAVFVDAARCLALAHGIDAIGTPQRLRAAGQAMGAPRAEFEGWASAFEVLQGLRLRAQVNPSRAAAGRPNHIDLDELNDLELRVLREVMHLARDLQQRLEMDWVRD